MKIGTWLYLEIWQPEAKEIHKYYCKIIEKDEQHLYVDHPIDERTKKTVFFMEGTAFRATYIDLERVVYTFHTQVIGKRQLNIPALVLVSPDEASIQKVQRREFVRIESAVDVAVHFPDHTLPSFVTVTSDISGGGISMIIPDGLTLSTEGLAQLCLVLHMHNKEYKFIHTEAALVHTSLNENFASFEFHTISKDDQQSIIRYCFEKQREARNKEMS